MKIKKWIKWSRKQNMLFLFCFLPTFAFASDTSSDMLSTVLNGLISLLTSTPARLIFVLSIASIGYGCLALGKIPRNQAIVAAVGIGIVFSASYIASALGLGV